MKSFIRIRFLLFIAVSIFVLVNCGDKTPAERPFLMGFSAAPHERTSSGKVQAKQFLAQYADLAAEDFSEGVPWEESLRGVPLPSEVLVSLRIRKRMLEAKSRVLLISPLNLKQTDIGIYWPVTAEESIKKSWSAKKFGDPDVTSAYLKFCHEMIRQFHPKYFGYGVDVNRFADARPDQWNAFIDFARDVYHGLKEKHPNIPIFIGFDVCNFWKNTEKQEQRIRELLPYSDYIAVSAYPHLSGYNDVAKLPRDFFERLAKIDSSKPFAIVDTGYPSAGHSSSEDDSQKRYLEFVLHESYKLKAKFMIWFHYRDFKKVVEEAESKHKLPEVIQLFNSRKECGLVDDAGQSKISHSVWKQWYQLPIVNPKSKSK